MKVEKIDTHSVVVDLLEPEGYVLDVGCRGFEFARRMAAERQYVVALDPDPSMEDPEITRVIFENHALAHGEPRSAPYASWSTGEGNHLCEGRQVPRYAKPHRVQCTNIQRIMERYDIDQFEVVKFDCEGAEYEILRNWPGPVAKQISVEFHDFTGYIPAEDVANTHRAIVNRLSTWYYIVQHDKTPHLGIPGRPVNYWDSLFVLRELHAPV